MAASINWLSGGKAGPELVLFDAHAMLRDIVLAVRLDRQNGQEDQAASTMRWFTLNISGEDSGFQENEASIPVLIKAIVITQCALMDSGGVCWKLSANCSGWRPGHGEQAGPNWAGSSGGCQACGPSRRQEG